MCYMLLLVLLGLGSSSLQRSSFHAGLRGRYVSYKFRKQASRFRNYND